jgi:hypothetical protein
MTSRRLLLAGLTLLVILLVGWIGANTTWEPTEVPTPRRGEARTNPFYTAGRFAEALGARTDWRHTLGDTPADAVIVASSFHWDLIPSRQRALERWVENGGRLVVDDRFLATEAFLKWSGIRRKFPEPDDEDDEDDEDDDSAADLESAEAERCQMVSGGGSGTRERYRLCDYFSRITLRTTEPVLWSLSDDEGMQAIRVGKGRGTVTMINADPFATGNLLDRDSDHARLFVAATMLRERDVVHFISENERPSLLALIWRHGAPVVWLAAAWLGVVLWRGGGRLGPQAPDPEPARRSLAEQIRGTAHFALRLGGGEALYAATLRAFNAAAGTRIPAFTTLDTEARAAAVARLTRFDAAALAGAMTTVDFRRGAALRGAIALLEAARRQLLTRSTGPTHGTD